MKIMNCYAAILEAFEIGFSLQEKNCRCRVSYWSVLTVHQQDFPKTKIKFTWLRQPEILNPLYSYVTQMKILIITPPIRTNFGGIWQAYALQTILERLGHDVFICDEKQKLSKFSGRLFQSIKQLIKICIDRSVDYIWPVYNYPTISKNTGRFVNKYLKLRLIEKIWRTNIR